ncbi:General transcription factor II-I repeat domain-containing protein 2, partial [Nosema granulosis]
MSRKRSIQEEGRTFQSRWKLDYFCTEINNEIICLLCQKKIGAAKEYNINRHYNTKHYEEYNVFEGIIREEKFEKLLSSFNSQHTFFSKLSIRNKSLTRVSYEISYILGCRGKPFSDGELIKDCMIRAAELICPEVRQKFADIPLSRNTVAERIGDISDNLTSQIRDLATKFMSFSLAVDESTDIRDVAKVSVFFRGCDIDMNITEELLDIIPLKATTMGKDIFEAVMRLLEYQHFPLEKLVSVTTDGAKS